MKQSREDFLKQLSDQIYFLKRSCEYYDKGYNVEAKNLATHIRVLVHDTKNSVSLLKYLKCKENIKYFNTALPETQFGLCGIKTTSDNGGRTFYSPPLGNLSEIRLRRPWIQFKFWWEDMKVLSDGIRKFSRKDLVLAVANKDGGAHVDENLPDEYAELTRNNSLNVYHEESGILIDVPGVELASIRQVAFEMLTTLEKKFPELFFS